MDKLFSDAADAARLSALLRTEKSFISVPCFYFIQLFLVQNNLFISGVTATAINRNNCPRSLTNF